MRPDQRSGRIRRAELGLGRSASLCESASQIASFKADPTPNPIAIVLKRLRGTPARLSA